MSPFTFLAGYQASSRPNGILWEITPEMDILDPKTPFKVSAPHVAKMHKTYAMQ